MITKLFYWGLDYLYALTWQLRALGRSRPPVPDTNAKNGTPVILIPGVYEPWLFMEPIANALQLTDHPVYYVEELGYHTMQIDLAAQAVRRLINKHRLKNVSVIAHSKGGLVGKYLLSHYNSDAAVTQLIAIATPFSGSIYARWWLLNTVRTLSPRNPLIRELQAILTVNAQTISIYGQFDPHIPGGSHLENAVNIKVPCMGHFRILNQTAVKEAVVKHL